MRHKGRYQTVPSQRRIPDGTLQRAVSVPPSGTDEPLEYER